MNAGRFGLVAILIACSCGAFAQEDITIKTNEANPIVVRKSTQPLRAIDARLFRAIKSNDTEGVEALLTKGANANAQDTSNTTPLQLAAYHAKHPIQMMQVLIAHGAKVDYRGLDKGSSLLIAILTDHPDKTDTIRFLLDHGANANDRSWTGQTPLISAINARSLQDVTMLLKHGADANAPSVNPFQDLKWDLPKDAIDFNACATAPIFQAVVVFNPQIFDLLVHSGADLKVQDVNGYNLYHYAVFGNDPRAIAALAAAGLNVNAVSKKGFSALHFEVNNSQVLPQIDIVRALLKAGADPQLKTPAGKTSVDLYRAYLKANGLKESGDEILSLLDRKNL